MLRTRQEVFSLAWEFFLRKHDDFFASNFDPFEVLKTFDDVASAMTLLETVGLIRPSVRDFWWSNASQIATKYAFWICDLVPESPKH
jgi:hypothetical protein